MISNHLKFINQAHQIASKNLGKTFPNPSVGCLICKNNQIISKEIKNGPDARKVIDFILK